MSLMFPKPDPKPPKAKYRIPRKREGGPRRVSPTAPKPAVIVYADEREVCTATTAGKAEYARRREEMATRQGGKCAICGHRLGFIYVWLGTFDHECSRGGGKRDDRILHDDGTWRNAAVHSVCNGLKGSQRFAWQCGVYRKVEK